MRGVGGVSMSGGVVWWSFRTFFPKSGIFIVPENCVPKICLFFRILYIIYAVFQIIMLSIVHIQTIQANFTINTVFT